MNTIKLTSVFERNSKLLYNIIDEEVVILSIDNEEYYHLNITASKIWNLLKVQLSYNELASQLVKEFDIDLNTCIDEIEQYIIELVELNIIDLIE